MQPENLLKKKNAKIYVFLMIGPFIGLILSAIVQVLARIIGDPGSVIVTVLNVLSFFVGLFAIPAILLLPLWVVLYVKADNYNKNLMHPPQNNFNDNTPPNRPQ